MNGPVSSNKLTGFILKYGNCFVCFCTMYTFLAVSDT